MPQHRCQDFGRPRSPTDGTTERLRERERKKKEVMAGSCAVCMFPAIELTLLGRRVSRDAPSLLHHLRHYDAPSRPSPFASATEMPGPQRKPCLHAVAERAELGEGTSRLGLMSWLAGWLFMCVQAVQCRGRDGPRRPKMACRLAGELHRSEAGVERVRGVLCGWLHGANGEGRR